MEVTRAPHYLLVDDHSLIREGMMQAIRSLDPQARFTQANNLQSALQCLQDSAGDPIDVVLLDLGLPDSRGMATLQTMRQAAPTQRIGIITGHSDVQIALECIHHGASCFIPKLAEIDGFMTALKALVEGRLHFPSELLSPSEVDFPTPDDDTARRTIRLTPRQKELMQELAASFGLKEPQGALINSVEKGGPAAPRHARHAGLQRRLHTLHAVAAERQARPQRVRR